VSGSFPGGTSGRNPGCEVTGEAVLGVEGDGCVGVGAEAAAHLYEPSFASKQPEVEPGDRGVGDMTTDSTTPRTRMTHVATSHLGVLELALGPTKRCALRS
jgi:hypothetical protein